LAATAAALGCPLSEQHRAQFQTYLETLQTWNRSFNLTAARHPDHIVSHFLEALTYWPTLVERLGAETRPVNLIDVGTGAGFPGLPLKIVHPAWDWTLVDASRKRIHFLQHLARQLGLDGLRIVWGRAEEIGQDPGHRERYAAALARSVAPLAVLVEYGLPLVRVGGFFLASKGARPEEECAAADRAIRRLGGGTPEVLPVEPVEARAQPRSLLLIPKLQATPPEYPRRVGLPAKRPLRGENDHVPQTPSSRPAPGGRGPEFTPVGARRLH